MTTRILIADDHGVLRAGLRALLSREPDVEVVGEARSGEEAIRLARQLVPDIVLLDIAMPGPDGIEVTRTLKGTCPDTRVLILTASEEKGILTEALHAGASGYVVKRAVEAELVAAIVAVMRGDVYVDPAVTRLLIDSRGAAPVERPGDAGEALTPREREICGLLALGMTNAQVADRLTLSRRTVESHRANLMAKIHAHTRTDLVRYAALHKLLPEEANRK